MRKADARNRFRPLEVISLYQNEIRMPALLVLCRAPADDGWLAVESSTAIVYVLFDSICHLYEPQLGHYPSHKDLKTRSAQQDLLARATWFHRPKDFEKVPKLKKVPA